MCNLKLKKCSINIIQSLHSVYMHIEDVHLLLYSHKQTLGGIKESHPEVHVFSMSKNTMQGMNNID
jgi:predicted RNase H-like nuclease